MQDPGHKPRYVMWVILSLFIPLGLGHWAWCIYNDPSAINLSSAVFAGTIALFHYGGKSPF